MAGIETGPLDYEDVDGWKNQFLTVVTILNGVDGNIPIEYSYDPNPGTLIYQYPATRIDTNSVKEDGEAVNEIQSMLETVSEMIYLTSSNTSILSGQTQRKKIEGGDEDRHESIIYAGMYLDDSFTSGGGAIK